MSAAGAATSAAVVDTGVFSAVVLRAGGKRLRDAYAQLLRGRRIVLAAQTVAELRFGARHGGWSAERRTALRSILEEQTIAPVDDVLIESYVDLRHRRKALDHPLGYKGQHEQDRWIAATALRYGLPLVAHGGVFLGVPGLQLLTTLTDPT
jgi:tRNA(fMet)-specific endonuclease VapC